MVARKQLEEIAGRKEIIRAECELHRCSMAFAAQTVSAKLQWVDTTSRWLGKLAPVLPIAAAVGGVFLARGGGRVTRFATRLVSGYQLARTFMRR